MRSRDRIAVGWLDPGQVDGAFMMSLLALYRGRPERIAQVLRVQSGGLLSRGRNELVAGFLATDCDWLLMLDSDLQLEVPKFDKLVAAAHADQRPIVAGLYFAAWTSPGLYPAPVPTIYRVPEGTIDHQPIYDYLPDRVIPVDAAGTGCLLIHRRVFEAMRESASDHEGKDWCWFMDMPVGGRWLSEDLYFCRKAASLGIPMHAHTGVTLPHHKSYWLTDEHHRTREVRG